jgi:hypothetical protein
VLSRTPLLLFICFLASYIFKCNATVLVWVLWSFIGLEFVCVLWSLYYMLGASACAMQQTLFTAEIWCCFC